MIMPSRSLVFGLLLAAALLPTGPGVAGPHGNGVNDHDEVRIAVEKGEIKPLVELLKLVGDQMPGEVTGIDIERKHGIWLYEFRVIDKAGRLFEVYVDANSGDLRRVKEK
ncbi:PepSY domain-containing protein [Rhodopseudomonas palustris]|nr:PepSY domain-containing protein [Rhodopseudomonas palustris]